MTPFLRLGGGSSAHTWDDAHMTSTLRGKGGFQNCQKIYVIAVVTSGGQKIKQNCGRHMYIVPKESRKGFEHSLEGGTFQRSCILE